MAEFRQMPPDDPYKLTGEAIISARSGDTRAVEQTLARIRQLAGDAGSYQYGQVRAQAGDVNSAFADLDVAMKAKDPGLTYAKTDPFLDPIRGDPRYAALLKALNFP
jgi:hypothetical protein